MKRPLQFICPASLAIASICLFSSCEDKAMIQKNEELRKQVSELEKEVDLLEINAGDDPGDQTAAIERANTELTTALGELEKLDGEKVKLEDAHTKLEKEFRIYQRKYQIK
jgi:outer membrane murein-binding lipoprotein Lpp